MTDIGYQNIIDRIVIRTIETPKAITVQELKAWMDGYFKCQQDILRLIEEMRRGQGE